MKQTGTWWHGTGLRLTIAFISVLAAGCQTLSPAGGSGEYVDVYAVQCPSSYDAETQRFRNENFWIFQRRHNEDRVSRVLRPNRETASWRADVEPSDRMLVTQDGYVWISRIYGDSINTFDRKRLIMERKWVEKPSLKSQCREVSPRQARHTVATEY